MLNPSRRVAVIMQRRAIDNRWQSEVWEPSGILQDYPGAEIRPLVETPSFSQWLYPGFDIILRKSEAEGYFHNVSANAPMAFVLWRAEADRAVPHFVTVSYDEASRWMDGGAQVDAVALPAALSAWLRAFVDQNYRPEPKKRIRPRSFLAPAERTQ
ncbi:MAG: DUF3305 domain-containing protein [Betaproteobacteria bacterium]